MKETILHVTESPIAGLLPSLCTSRPSYYDITLQVISRRFCLYVKRFAISSKPGGRRLF